MLHHSDNLCFLSAAKVAAAIRAREVSPVEVIDALAARIKRCNPVLNAFCTLTLDEARASAGRAQEELARGDQVGPLHGVPVAVKDDLPVAGVLWTSGSRLFQSRVADHDDVTVARLKRAGAIIIGKTNLPEGGHKGTTDNLLFGATANPWDATRTPGGSSGGSGAAVAAGLAYLALGTDIGGSIRIPASCCGVVGHKPTFGRIPRVPAGNAFVTQWVSGPLARTVADTVLAMRVLSGPDERDLFSLLPDADWDRVCDLRGVCVGWSVQPFGGPVEGEVARAVEEAMRSLAAAGLRVEPVPELIRPPLEALRVIFSAATLADAGIDSAETFRDKRPLLSPTFAAFLEMGVRLTLRDYVAAQWAVTEFLETTAETWFAGHDLLAIPTLRVTPFSRDLPLGPNQVAGQAIDPQLDWACTWPFNLTGQPAVSVPCGWTAEGLPIGLQLVGRRGADNLVLRVAAALERVSPWSVHRPALQGTA
jgi:aspartyl-tRNA(Asn)/glutamyl-tRNA(Gln) amidotransferase subunit A